MTSLVALSFYGASQLKFHWVERYDKLLVGSVLCLVGILTLIFHDHEHDHGHIPQLNRKLISLWRLYAVVVVMTQKGQGCEFADSDDMKIKTLVCFSLTNSTSVCLAVVFGYLCIFWLYICSNCWPWKNISCQKVKLLYNTITWHIYKAGAAALWLDSVLWLFCSNHISIDRNGFVCSLYIKLAAVYIFYMTCFALIILSWTPFPLQHRHN